VPDLIESARTADCAAPSRRPRNPSRPRAARSPP